MTSLTINELSEYQLDIAVAMIQELPIKHDPMGFKSGSEAGAWIWDESTATPRMEKIGQKYSPTTHWSQGGIILESDHLHLTPPETSDDLWTASTPCKLYSQQGETALIAIVRCYVSKYYGKKLPTLSNTSHSWHNA